METLEERRLKSEEGSIKIFNETIGKMYVNGCDNPREVILKNIGIVKSRSINLAPIDGDKKGTES